MLKDAEYTAAALYDGGWRAEDREDLIAEYEFDEEEIESVVSLLEKYERWAVEEK